MTTINIERAAVYRALSALEYHTQQTRPIHNTELVIEELRDALATPATAPEQPSWQDAPTCAGVWMCHMNGEAYQWPDKNLDVTGTRWFGPIPEDKP